MVRAVSIVSALAVCLMVSAQTTDPVAGLDKLMAHHRRVIAQLKLKPAQAKAVKDIDTKYQSDIREKLQQIIRLKAGDPLKASLATKIKSGSNAYREALKNALGDRWQDYARAYGSGVSTSETSAKVTSPVHKRSKRR